MEKVAERNQTLITEFIIVGFGEVPELRPLLILMFLVIYIVTLAGNILIIALVVADRQLHTPMYFLLWNLACLETCFSSAIVPRLLSSLLTGDRTVSINGCTVQLYFFGVLSTIENMILAAMSYDRYLAICHPLHYAALMNGKVCGQLVVASWISGFLSCAIVNAYVWQLTFCDSKEIDHYFCAFVPMLKLACTDTQTLQLLAFVVAAVVTLIPCLLTLTSYAYIIATVLKIPSTAGRKKAFSKCSSHLTAVAVYYVIVFAVSVVPIVNASKIPEKIFSVFCTVLNPMINPVIYCLRNKEFKECLRKAVFYKLSAF
ncbi:olfactory receptor 6F1-like [Carettochelys insculpta]|uniref:olfactory receptor 6F1-like n=1 Tax=Carettochelys insculpta TaxID=44489 RepID=UPI003EB77B60